MGENPDRWEQGSEFHWVPPGPRSDRVRPPWEDGLLLGSGRDALRLLIGHGRDARGWRRLLVPAYLCQEVVAACVGGGVDLHPYLDHPLAQEPELPTFARGDALLHVNYFGVRSGPSLTLPVGVDLVEDHTHDPLSAWARSSTADFAIASLRKTLPIPDGGVLWSPRGHRLPAPPPVSLRRERASARKFAAMVLKRLYLEGEPIRKHDFRTLALAGENEIAAGEVSSMPHATRQLVGAYATEEWRARRKENHARLAELLGSIPWLGVIGGAARDTVPFSMVVVLDSEAKRERIRARLVERDVYPAVLWPLDNPVLRVPDEVRALSRRVLSLHCDGRYGPSDLERVAAIIGESR